MRPPSMLAGSVAVAVVLATMACGGQTDADAADAASDAGVLPTPGMVTFRFRNSLEPSIYVDWAVEAKDAKVSDASGPLYTYASCPVCECGHPDTCGALCGPTMPRVKRIDAGESFDVVWNATAYYPGGAGEGAPSCYDHHVCPLGPYGVSLAGSRGVLPGGSPEAGDPTVIDLTSLDPSPLNRCEASATFDLGELPQVVSVELYCAK